jgi:hypothetical protein
LHSLEPEIHALRAASAGGAAADVAAPGRVDFELPAQLESGRIFSLHRELLIALYGCVTAVIGGVGLLVRNNLDHIGPVTLTAALLLAAALCYATAIRTQRRGTARSIAGDYVLLLGALLLSAAVGYAEVQFHLLGTGWSRHLLLLAVVHAGTAYALDSKLVLSVALTSFAGWLGAEASFGNLWEPQRALLGLGWRTLACAVVFRAAGAAHRHWQARPDFLDVFEHFAANFGFWGALALLFDAPTRWIGAALLAALAIYVGIVGFRRGRETFVLYAIGYATLGLAWLEGVLIDDRLLELLVVLLTLIGAVVLLWRVRAQMKADRT